MRKNKALKVSVIVPVYNGEEHLRQCMESIINQTLREIEIICVDDESTDSSFSILEEYARKDNRIVLLRQKKSNAGAARNYGKSQARGEYLVFWDCDDYFDLNALEKIYKRAVQQQADICVCGANQYFAEKGRIAPNVKYYMDWERIPKEPVFNRITNENHILTFTNEAAWNKMYRRAYIEQIGLDFQEVRNGNDVYFTVNALCLADRITTISKPLVTYRKNQKQSLVGTLSHSSLTPFMAWTASAKNLIAMDAFPERSFANKAVGSMVYLLRNITERNAFFDACTYLKDEGLEAMHIRVQEDGYYYVPWYNEFVYHIINDSIEDFQCWLAFRTYTEMTEMTITRQMIKNSLPGKIYQKLKAAKSHDVKKIVKPVKAANSYGGTE